MNDFIDVKLAFSNYIHNIADVIYRYINNSALRKLFLFPLFLIILLLELALFPIALAGAIAKWIITFIVWLTEDKSQSLLFILIILFIEFLLIYYLVFLILLLFYKLFNLMSNGLGKANNETNADEYIASFSEKTSKEKSNVEEKNENDIYVIDDENYK